MKKQNYLQWLASNTETSWWHDSCELSELEEAIRRGAIGVTTNPCLVQNTIYKNTDGMWDKLIQQSMELSQPIDKAEKIVEGVFKKISPMFEEWYQKGALKEGRVCAQVCPKKNSEREWMIEAAKRYSQWAQNISVKFPATAAGLDALEECAALGISITSTLSFTVSQVIAAAERHKKGTERARAKGINPAPCYAVIMIGRVDDYIRDVSRDNNLDISEEEIIQSGIAVTKRAYQIFKERNYEAILLPAGMRGAYHATELAGADLILSIHPKIQKMILDKKPKFEERINIPVNSAVISNLSKCDEFKRAYEPSGMAEEEFVTYGALQKTASQFVVAGWDPLENL